MPVTDLADYLGMPQQAPADPLFYQKQREAAYAQEASDFNQNVAARNQLYRLQRQAPVLQAQQAQLAYDDVAQQARDLRMKQEIEAQVERAASELAGGNLNPESDDFAFKYRDLATRNPLAFSDPRFKNVAGLYEGQHQNYQQARAAQAEAEARAAQARIDAENSAYAFGVPAGRITPEMSIRDINIERGKVKTAGAGTRGSTQDASLQMMQKDYELVGSRLKAMEDAGQSVLYDKDGAEIPNPKFDELAKEHDRLFNELRGSYQGKYRPAEATPTTQTGIGGVSGRTLGYSGIPVRPKEQAAAPVPFKDTMKGLATPKAEDILKVNEAEIIQDLNDPSADDGTFMLTLKDPAASEKVKREALNRLKEFAKAPKFPIGTGPSEARKRIADLANKIKDGERELRKIPEQAKINAAWSSEKADMSRYIDEYAKSLGLDPDIISVGIARDDPLEEGFDSQGQKDTYRDDFSRFLRKKMGINGDPLSKQSDRLFPFQGGEFAEDFGLQGNIPGFRSIGKGKTYNQILDAVLAERIGPVAKITKESPTGMPLTEQQQKDLDELKTLAGSK
jgi:hypothetical protein